MENSTTNHGNGIMRSLRKTADGLVDLVGQHLKLARIELAGDLVVAVKRARLLAVLALLTVIGYALTMTGLAMVLGGHQQAGVAFLAVGLVHVGMGVMGMLLAASRTRGTPLMSASTDEARRSLATVAAAGSSAELEKIRAP